jgi:hypothetical protein
MHNLKKVLCLEKFTNSNLALLNAGMIVILSQGTTELATGFSRS